MLGGKKTGGMNVYIRELARQLGRLGILVDIYTRRVSSEQPVVDMTLGENVRVIHVVAGPIQLLDPDQVYSYLSQFTAGVIAFTTKNPIEYDLIYSHYWLSGWVANKLKEVWNIPFVHMFHTLGHMKQRIATSTAYLPDVRIAVETQIVNWADRIIAATQAEQAQLLWLYRTDRRKIVVIPPGVDLKRFHPLPKDQAKRQIGVDENNHLLLFVGRIEPLKAVDTILEAVALIHQYHPNLCVGIIGGNPKNPADAELNRLQMLAQSLCIDGIVNFLGAKDHNLLPLYYAAASIVIVPSDYESFGMVALEAMASGTPVIASEVGGLAFLVRDEETGFLVPARDPSALANGIRTILTQPEKRKELGENAVALAHQYTWSGITQQLVTVFNDVVQNHKRFTRRKH
ncbi:MAG: glycosyltransferase family 1 protein [Chloroflexi bacterium]|nr:MAG: glycosyltransferase family 1 protein [Chloroflexota bacterium]